MSEEEVFDLGLQSKVLALLVKDRPFLVKYMSCIKPYYFDSEVHMDLCRIVLDYYKKYSTNITVTALLTEIQDFLNKNPRPNKEDYILTVKSIREDLLPERLYIYDYIKKFIKLQEHKKALLTSIDKLKHGDYDGIRSIMESAYKAGSSFDDGMLFFDSEQIDQRWQEEDVIRVPTGIVEINTALDGGLEGGELGIVLGSTGIGKSLILTIIAVGAVMRGKKVLYITLELRGKKVGRRFDRALLNKTMMTILSNKAYYKQELLEKKLRDWRGNLYVQYYPTRSASVYDIKHLIEGLQAQDFCPDVVFIDYVAITKPVQSREARHLEIEESTELLRGMGGEMNIPIWTIAQTKSSAINKKFVDLDETGEAFAQAKVADVVVVVCQTRDEYKDGTIRLITAKCREHKKYESFNYNINYSTLTLHYNPTGSVRP